MGSVRNSVCGQQSEYSKKNCLGWFLCVGLFGSMWFFLWSSIQVHVPLVSICSFQVLVCREWSGISWTRNHVFHHGLAFSSLVSFLVSFWVNRRVFLLSGLLCALLILLSYSLSIRPLRYVFCCYILVPNRSVSFASGCWDVFVSSPLSCW